MLLPVRCFTCGKVLGNKWKKLEELTAQHAEMLVIYRELGLERYCCKKVIMTFVSTLDTLLKYDQLPRELEVKETL